MPKLDELMEKGTILTWLKKEGDKVEEGEVLVEVMSSKITFEAPAPTAGVLYKIFVQPEVEVPIGKTIAIIVQPGDDLEEVNNRVKELELIKARENEGREN
jgi:pyruvate/2-oxoglutarate dehydrogenase complex dihydrolipoamide acyltransferase (E2) component